MALRRFLTLQCLLIWQGGFVFYAAVVVPIGAEVLGSAAAQGTITQQVTTWMNRLGVVALGVLAWDAASTSARRASRWTVWGGMAISLAALFYLHAVLDANFDAVRKMSPDPAAFRFVHGAYLCVSTILWLFGLVFTWLTIRAWASPPLERVPG